MRRQIKNNKGLTLIEVLAVTALLSLILLLMGGAHLSGQKQYTNQTTFVNDQANVRLAVKSLVKDIRSNPSAITVGSSSVTVGTTVYEYKLAEQAIFKNGAPLAENIQSFAVTKTDSKIAISVVSLPNEYGHSTSISTTVYARK